MYSVHVVDPRPRTDGQIAELNGLNQRVYAEMWPGDPPTPVEMAIAVHRATPARFRWQLIEARASDGELVGATEVVFDPEHDDNPELCRTAIHVAPAHRRRGVGTLLVTRLVQVAEAEGRTRLMGQTVSTARSGAAFAAAIGAVAKAELHVNHLPVSSVNRMLLQQWVDEAPRRAPGYELVAWDGAVPDESLAAFVDLVLVMNDAPRDELNIADFTVTPEHWREQQKIALDIGAELWTLVARRVSDGALAGYHDVHWMPDRPKVVHVGSTGVRAEHRGHALGKWLKATMMLRILDERPQVGEVRTTNADSNDAMLRINQAMGYVPLNAMTTWELSTVDAKRWLAQNGMPRGTR